MFRVSLCPCFSQKAERKGGLDWRGSLNENENMNENDDVSMSISTVEEIENGEVRTRRGNKIRPPFYYSGGRNLAASVLNV